MILLSAPRCRLIDALLSTFVDDNDVGITIITLITFTAAPMEHYAMSPTLFMPLRDDAVMPHFDVDITLDVLLAITCHTPMPGYVLRR